MPLSAHYTWAESETTLKLSIPLKGCSPNKVDIFVTDVILKVSFPPHLLDINLKGCIDDEHSRAKVINGVLDIEIQKAQDSKHIWGEISISKGSLSKEDVKKRREESIRNKREREKNLADRMKSRKFEDERKMLKVQMASESAERQHLEDVKEAEKIRAENEVFEVLKKFKNPIVEESNDNCPKVTKEIFKKENLEKIESVSDQKPSTLSNFAIENNRNSLNVVETTESDIDNQKYKKSIGKLEKILTENGINFTENLKVRENIDFKTELNSSQSDFDPKTGQNFVESEHTCLPAPRLQTNYKVNFTPRLFPTPARESKAKEENVWIMKNRKHLSKNALIRDRLPPGFTPNIEEVDPIWLKGRGDDFFRAGDWLSAVNAYSAALEADDLYAPAISNRAASYLKLNRLDDCILDCTRALAILAKGGDVQMQMMRLCIRRSTALCQQGHYQSSIQDLKAALEFTPGDSTIISDIERVEQLFRCEEFKKKGDLLLAKGDLEGACAQYTQAISFGENCSVSSLSNRAGCYLGLGQPQQCIDDCTVVLNVLSDSSLMHRDNEKKPRYMLCTLVRRAAAYNILGKVREAILDYKEALKLAPNDEKLLQDLKNLENALR